MILLELRITRTFPRCPHPTTASVTGFEGARLCSVGPSLVDLRQMDLVPARTEVIIQGERSNG